MRRDETNNNIYLAIFDSIAILMPLWTVSLVIFVFDNDLMMRVL